VLEAAAGNLNVVLVLADSKKDSRETNRLLTGEPYADGLQRLDLLS